MKNIQIYGEIGGIVKAAEVVQAIQDAEGEPLEMHLNSLGGNVFDGYAIASAVKRHGQVTAFIDGIAASIAAYIAASAARVVMASGSMFMIHLPEASTEGTAAEHRKNADLLDKITAELVSLFSTKTSLEPARVEELLNAETWYTAAEALDAGLIDAIEGRADITPTADRRALNFGKTYQIAAIARQIPPESTQADGSQAKTTLPPTDAAERKIEAAARRTRIGQLYDYLQKAAAHDERIADALAAVEEEEIAAAAAQDCGTWTAKGTWGAYFDFKQPRKEQPETPRGFTTYPRN